MDIEDNFNSDQEIQHPITIKRPLKGLWVPIEILMHPDLSPTEKLLFAELHALSNMGNGCFASNEYLSMMFDLNPNAVSRMISNMKSIGIVWQDSFDGRQRILKTDKRKALPGYIKRLKNDINKTDNLKNNRLKLKLKTELNSIIDCIENLSINQKVNAGLTESLNIGNSKGKDNKSLSKDNGGEFDNSQPSSKRKRNAPIPIEIITPSPVKEKKIKQQGKSFILPGSDAEKIVNYWNSLKSPNPRYKLTRHLKWDTKAIQSVVIWIDELKAGTFAKPNGKKWREHFFQGNKIPFTFTTPIKLREITQLMTKYLDFFKEGYYPQNKENLPLSLPGFILSGFPDKTSYLLKCKFNPADEQKNKAKDYRPKYTECFKRCGLLQDIDAEDMPAVYKGISSIEQRILRERVFDFNDPRVRMKFGKRKEKEMVGLFEEYAQFVADEYNEWKIADVFDQWGKCFKDFVRTMQQEWEG